MSHRVTTTEKKAVDRSGLVLLGKITGTAFGFLFFSYAGGIIGFMSGHILDRYIANRHIVVEDTEVSDKDRAERVRQSFFKTTFSVMGYVAKIDGSVKPAHIKHTEKVIKQMGLNDELRDDAIGYFTLGKQSDFNLGKQVKQFRKECAGNTNLFRMLLEVQVQVALADGVMVAEEERVLLRVASLLGFSETVYRRIEVLVRISMGLGDDHSRRYSKRSKGKQSADDKPRSPVDSAYILLAVSAADDQDTVTKAYRKLMSQHHPDRLIAQGMPEEGLRLATNKTHEIRKAFEQIKRSKGWN